MSMIPLCVCIFQDALEILAKAADYKNDDINYSRALAFRRASCVFKSLSAPLISVQQARKLYNIGAHVRRVIQVQQVLIIMFPCKVGN